MNRNLFLQKIKKIYLSEISYKQYNFYYLQELIIYEGVIDNCSHS
jgi:hypothetical protein